MSQSSNNLLAAVCREGVLCATSVRYWRGCKQLKAEDLGLDATRIDDRLFQLGQKRLVPRESLAAFALVESRAHALVEQASFPFLGGIARFVPNARLAGLTEGLDALREEFREATLDFVAGYGSLRSRALDEWRDAAARLDGDGERLLITIEQSFPPADVIARRFGFDIRLFQVAAPDSLRLESATTADQLAIADQRRRVAEDASRRLQGDLNGFINESVTTLREETARLVTEVMSTIENSETGVHQRTLNRLATFIDQFRSLNFAGDQQLETTLERFRENLLGRSAEVYRNDSQARQSLTDGLSRLRETAVQLARGDTRDIVVRFGQLGGRKLTLVG